VLFIAVLAFVLQRPEFLDLALVYALINFVGVIAVLRYTKYGHFADPEEDEETS
jgi:multicomponent Na+:H+ antiporter subunit F